MRTAIVRTDRYDRGAIAFHWTIAVLIVLNIALAWFGDSLFDGLPAMPWHKAIGITVLVLSIGRLAWRWTHRPPPLPRKLKPWERGTARVTHWAFYGFMLGMPLTGWALSSGTDVRRPLTWLGWFDIPYLPVSLATGDAAHAMHEVGGPILAALIALHVAAALRHHFILRDGTLARIVPGLAPRR